MGSLFSAPKIKTPKPVEPGTTRMPVETDMTIREAALRRRKLMGQRQGYQSTILSDALSGGSSTLG
jgi:hypothetical protein